MSDLLGSIAEFLKSLNNEIIGLVFSLVTAAVLYAFRLRPRLKYGLPHRSRHVLNVADKTKDEPENLVEVYNEQFFVSNEGRRPATNVDVVLSNFPRNVAVNPPCDWTFKNVENGHCQISIPYIAPRELMTIDCIYLNQKAAFISAVRCSESIGKPVNFWSVRRFPDGVNWLIRVLIILGFAFVIQLGFDSVDLLMQQNSESEVAK